MIGCKGRIYLEACVRSARLSLGSCQARCAICNLLLCLRGGLSCGCQLRPVLRLGEYHETMK